MHTTSRRLLARSSTKGTGTLAIASLALATLAGCMPNGHMGTQVAAWNLVDPTQRHPIMVSQEPSDLKIKIAPHGYGLSPQQRASVAEFVGHYRDVNAQNSKLIVSAPTGSKNEVASMRAIAEIRHLIQEMGFDRTSVSVESYHAAGIAKPPIRISYTRYVAKAPECKSWSTNLAQSPANLNYPNLGCATQKNLAAMIANPADLLGPRTMTARPGERRDEVWDKYLKGQSTIAKKDQDQKVSTQDK
ncbi:MAG: hypothetical protein RLZ98_2790 [Pseudomonadota bacterium]|jgi:pilus assembly protein CpaD